ncbi:FlgT C-terminal domain-containing protein [Synechocystis sp. LKSZ1]|uniref:FlgT C-terminal domain-containing protein n=1 Tax=Synechocystis sp. LKSZ1 TaxID=3144951 RepID=UPI00336BD929
MENQSYAPMIAKPGAFPAKVARVIDNYKLVINRGKEHGIREGQRVMIYKVDQEQIVDPDTGKLLGNLELVKGTGKVFQVEDKYAIIESDKTYQKLSINRRGNRVAQLFLGDVDNFGVIKPKEVILRPFDNPQVGDSVKPI